MNAALPAAAADHPATLAHRYDIIRATTDRLAAPLSPEDCQVQSMPDASPVKWHLAHTTWFFETFVLSRFVPQYTEFHASFRMLFNSYYHAVGERHPRPHRGLLSRPDLAMVMAYRRHVDAAMRDALVAGTQDTAFHALVELGLQHEQQHQELILTDVKHLLWSNPLRPVYHADAPVPRATSPCVQSGWWSHPGGIVTMGHEGAAFSFDNEGPAHQTLLQPHALATRLVTQGQYQNFIEDDGYRRPELWLSLGWDAVQAEGWTAPGYWLHTDSGWQVFTLQGLQAPDPHAPVVHLSYFEADAYARWAQARLPTEAEWENAARQMAEGGIPADANLLDVEPSPTGSAPASTARGLPAQLFGDVWEWTSSTYGAYPGFRPQPGAVGEYNGKFMCNQYVLRGGSCCTPRSHIRSTYRNFFPPQAQWQFAGLRLARDI